MLRDSWRISTVSNIDINAQLKARVAKVNELIEAFLPAEEGPYALIMEAMNYSVRVGGKRLRPILMLETMALFAQNSQALPYFMAALEMIHTYSLVHDDLPAMDNDKLRRGNPTTWAKYGETTGILAGDGLLNYAFETALGALDGVSSKEEQAAVNASLQLLARNAGIHGMIGGQVLDIAAESMESVSEEYLLLTYAMKTGALLRSSMLIGAFLGGASPEQVEKVDAIASKIGLAFQIQDDILDIIGDEATLGKPIGSDQLNEKSTIATIRGIEASQQWVAQLTQEALDILDTLPGDKEFLSALLKWLIYREV